MDPVFASNYRTPALSLRVYIQAHVRLLIKAERSYFLMLESWQLWYGCLYDHLMRWRVNFVSGLMASLSSRTFWFVLTYRPVNGRESWKTGCEIKKRIFAFEPLSAISRNCLFLKLQILLIQHQDKCESGRLQTEK